MNKKISQEGSFVWVVPDGYLPPGGEGEMKSHEALMILNTNNKKANVRMDIYFEDKDPVRDIPVTVGAERILCIRIDNPEQLGYDMPVLTQYSLRIRSDVKVIVQFGRMDVRQSNLAYYGTMAHPVK
ncbi:MAG: hypothetical protein UT30_C0008G0024 [Candidatus Uhrbacteria bacterium GW2011_GWF2_39_13]|uniref:Sensory rhodopsin transducer n=1 Tax=Candidatus Uhrbacteria bacterium GW2011_GWF2_39_13 TaxID=1618995 RepID=A0A0G0QRY2_9BACT|nr:MAG: hypothetical protein UT30_C0008G0024 [Candidatus Uhrbacteria bacterium GW2011_GWF2_39_13]